MKKVAKLLMMAMFSIPIVFGHVFSTTIYSTISQESIKSAGESTLLKESVSDDDSQSETNYGTYTTQTWNDFLVEQHRNGIDYDFVGGGTAKNPYKIETAEQLALLSYIQNFGHYPMVETEIAGATENQIGDTEYYELEYLEGTGTQYINSGVVAAYDVGFSIDFRLTATSGSGDSSTIMGAQNPNLGFGLSSGAFAFSHKNGTGKTVLSTIPCDFARHKAYNNLYASRTAYIDDETPLTLTDTLTASGKSIYLFKGYNGSSTTWGNGTVGIYGAQITKGNDLVRDFVPCYNKTTLELGLYDKVEGKFYKNAGTGEFQGVKIFSTSGKYFELTNDIYLNDGKLGMKEEADADGNATYNVDYTDGGDGKLMKFNSMKDVNFNFVSNENAIYGLYIDSTEDYQGFFGKSSKAVSGVTIKDCFVKGNDYVGAIVGDMNSKTSNSEVGGYVIGHNYVGGVAGRQRTHEKCVNYANVYGNAYVGGIQGGIPYGQTDKSIYSTNYGNIYGKSTVSGICGQGSPKYCINYGDVYGESGANGITTNFYYGEPSRKAKIIGCKNYGNLYSPGYVAGIISDFGFYVGVFDCDNYGNLDGGEYVGGICARIMGGVGVINCNNYGIIKGQRYVGGISGAVESDGIPKINKCNNYGEIISDESSSAGICGMSKKYARYAIISNCANYGKINKGYAFVSTAFSNWKQRPQMYNCINFGEIINSNTKVNCTSIFGRGIDYCHNLISYSKFNGVMTKVYAGEIKTKYCYDYRRGQFLAITESAVGRFFEPVDEQFLIKNEFQKLSA